ncbi:MAG: hypothetical protein JXR31_13140 [Prolixibacteraceae bacterium]|nr:hypothetical protein [Prolixibacteraceae bacterium]
MADVHDKATRSLQYEPHYREKYKARNAGAEVFVKTTFNNDASGIACL